MSSSHSRRKDATTATVQRTVLLTFHGSGQGHLRERIFFQKKNSILTLKKVLGKSDIFAKGTCKSLYICTILIRYPIILRYHSSEHSNEWFEKNLLFLHPQWSALSDLIHYPVLHYMSPLAKWRRKKRICRDFSRLELSIWGKKCKRAKNLLSNTTSKRDRKTQYLNSPLLLIKMSRALAATI